MQPLCFYRDTDLYFHHSIDPYPEESVFSMHIHEQMEIYCFIAGDARYLVEGTEYQLEPGSLLIMRPAESHKVKILSRASYERFSLHFSPGCLDSIDPARLLLEPFYRRPLGQGNLYIADDFPSGAHRALLEAMCAPAASEAERRLSILAHLYPLLAAIRGAFYQKKQRAESPPVSMGLLEDTIPFINRHLFEDLSLKMLSEKAFLSIPQFSRLFKNATGSSVWQYILIKRLLAAKDAIREGTPATDACRACGFHDYSAFYRAYKRYFGHSPQQDRPDPGL